MKTYFSATTGGSVCLAVAAVLWAAQPAPRAGMGVMVGEVTPTSAHVQVRLTETDTLVKRDVPGMAGVVEFVLHPADSPTKTMTQVHRATAERDFIARASFEGLTPGTRYVCKTRIGASEKALAAGPEASFQTHPGKDSDAPVRFVVVTGMTAALFRSGQAPRLSRAGNHPQVEAELLCRHRRQRLLRHADQAESANDRRTSSKMARAVRAAALP
jgi:hypothetical protein